MQRNIKILYSVIAVAVLLFWMPRYDNRRATAIAVGVLSVGLLVHAVLVFANRKKS